MFIYLGHGNGWPSPYAPFSKTSKDGLGLNRTSGAGNSNTKYWGEYYIARDIDFAPNAVVILNRLCYASGNSEWGRANPTKSTAIKRVDNYGAGFLRAGARAVFAHAIESASPTIRALFTTNRTMDYIFMVHPEAQRCSRLPVQLDANERHASPHGPAACRQVLAVARSAT